MFRTEYEKILEQVDNVTEKVESMDVRDMLNDIINDFESLYFDMNYEIEQRKDDIKYLERYVEDMRYRRMY